MTIENDENLLLLLPFNNITPHYQKDMKITESQALKRMAAYCSRAERCEYDVRKKLVALELTDEEIKRILDRLKKEKFLSDERFCHSFINDKAKFNKWGETKIRYELKRRNIPESVFMPILRELSADTFEIQLQHILKVKAKNVKAKSEYDKRNKLIRFALGRGFPMDMVVKNVNKLLGNDGEDYI